MTLVESALAFVFISFKEAIILFLLITAIFFIAVWGIGQRAKAVKQSKKS
ncbi:MAG: hypothetical protein M1503_01045 [Thaumarchaeota archaeon]|nr:hypothetical protein [Nitrososphaerota archaeon]MCL5316841.1 hypothetical protein [Nitrososphaerota archaeon]